MEPGRRLWPGTLQGTQSGYGLGTAGDAEGSSPFEGCTPLALDVGLDFSCAHCCAGGLDAQSLSLFKEVPPAWYLGDLPFVPEPSDWGQGDR